MTTRRMPTSYAAYAKRAYKRHDVQCSLEEFMAWLEAERYGPTGYGGGRPSKVFRCHYCPVSVSDVEWQLDHYVSRHHGGQSDLENLRVSCANCNIMKDTLPPDIFADIIALIEKHRNAPYLHGIKAADELEARLRASAGWRKRRGQIRTPKVRWK